MSKLEELKKRFSNEFLAFEAGLNGESKKPIHSLRKAAAEQFQLTPFPTIKDEEWKYTDVTSLAERDFSAAEKGKSKIKKEQIKKLLPKKLNSYLLVFINGVFDEKLSKLPESGAFTILPLKKAIEELPELVEEKITSSAQNAGYFALLNASFIENGAFIQLKDNTILDRPVYILYLTAVEKIHTQPRNIIGIGRNSEAVVIESYESILDSEYFTNSVTDIRVGENSKLIHVKIQDESLNAFHIFRGEVLQERYSTYTNYNLSFGARLGRNNINVVFNDENCESHLYGLYLTGGVQLIDNHTLIDHAKPNCASNELYKGVLNGNSRAVFNGKVYVRQQAQKTNAFQENKNILLSENATVDTKPQLEIFADDVKCSHGATVGQLDEKSLFYLRSRGISKELARDILIYAFADDTLRNLQMPAVVQYLEEKINRKLNSHF